MDLSEDTFRLDQYYQVAMNNSWRFISSWTMPTTHILPYYTVLYIVLYDSYLKIIKLFYSWNTFKLPLLILRSTNKTSSVIIIFTVNWWDYTKWRRKSCYYQKAIWRICEAKEYVKYKVNVNNHVSQKNFWWIVWQ